MSQSNEILGSDILHRLYKHSYIHDGSSILDTTTLYIASYPEEEGGGEDVVVVSTRRKSLGSCPRKALSLLDCALGASAFSVVADILRYTSKTTDREQSPSCES